MAPVVGGSRFERKGGTDGPRRPLEGGAAFSFWFMVIWVFITEFGDIFPAGRPVGVGRAGYILSEISAGGLR